MKFLSNSPIPVHNEVLNMTVFSLARNTTSASLPAARSIKYTASPCRLASVAFLTFSVGPIWNLKSDRLPNQFRHSYFVPIKSSVDIYFEEVFIDGKSDLKLIGLVYQLEVKFTFN